MKQIQAYDAYILKTKEELLEQDFETSFTKPKIKQPRVAERSTARYTDEQRKRLSLPFDPVGDNVASDIDTPRSIKDLVESHENVYPESANMRSLLSTRNVTTPVSLISEKESTKSHIEDDESQKSIADEAVVSDLSYSSIISEHLPSVTNSIASEKDVIEQESIEEDRSISGSQKTASLESSTETTIQTPIKCSEFESETKDDHPKTASDHASQTKDDDKSHKSSSEIISDIKEVDHQESISEILTATENEDYQKSVSEIISKIYVDDNQESSSEIVPAATENHALQKSIGEFMTETKDDDHLMSISEVLSEFHLKSSSDILLETKDDEHQMSSNEIITEIDDDTNHMSGSGDKSVIEDEDHHKSSSEITSKFNDHGNKTVSKVEDDNLLDYKDVTSDLAVSGVQSKAENEDSKELFKDTQLDNKYNESKMSGSETILESKNDDQKYSSDFDSTTAHNKDGMSSNEKSIEAVDSQSEKSISHISEDIPEEEHTTVSSNSAADEPSGTKSPEVIKIFLTEKTGKSNHDLTDSQVREAVKNESPELSLSTKLKEQISPYEQFKVHSVGDLINEESQDVVELNLNKENFERKANNKQYLTDSITDTILRNLLNESLSLSQKSIERVPHDLSTSITRLEIELSVKDDNLPSNEVILQGYDEPLHDADEELVEDVSPLDKTYCVQEKVDIDTQKEDQLVFSLLSQCLNDATSDVLDIYRAKKKSKQPEVTKLSPITGQLSSSWEDSTNIRKRVHEILAESSLSLNLSRETSRPQDFMVTAYDILSPSPETSPAPGSPIKEPFEDNQLDLTFRVDRTPEKKYEVELGVGLSAGGEPDGADNEGFAQEWFDDDFGLSHTRREAEELRLQQLQIEHEIQQLQQAQEQIPFYYVREIPNKPPPPYTPPSQTPRSPSPAPGVPRIPLSKQDLTKLASEEPRAVPASREDISALVSKATDYLYNVVEVGENLDLVNIPPDYFQDDEGEEDSSDLQKSSRKIFNKFIFDLSKQLVKDACGWEADKPCAAWEWPACSRKRKMMPPRSREMLHETVNRQVLLHFGLIPRASKENLVIRWSRKRRDYVDELLVRESHEEEPGWTNYEQDEVTVKNEVTMAIWNSLLDDTVEVFTDILNKKALRQQQVSSSLSPQ
ncbi:centrosome-associated protein 350 [Anabrus simplex]|uniref:centrosome-associated protein 350 n=1 Tax=Anabrus simplex TaxID=316456 RepID=UPI0035A2C2F1